MIQLKDYKVPEVPEGEVGHWRVKRFAVTEFDSRFAAIWDGTRAPYPGEYTGLTLGSSVIMSDTPAEIRDHLPVARWISNLVRNGRQPRLLIDGLGLGVVLKMSMLNGADHVTVVEKSPDVIKLTGEFWKEVYKDRLEIIEADAHERKPSKGERYDVIWHDIWGNLCTDNLEDMSVLHRRWARRCKFQGSWGRELLMAKKRQEKRQSWR